MELSGRIALLVFAAFLAGFVAWSAARAADAASIASDPQANACVIKPVMTDAEIDACRRR